MARWGSSSQRAAGAVPFLSSKQVRAVLTPLAQLLARTSQLEPLLWAIVSAWNRIPLNPAKLTRGQFNAVWRGLEALVALSNPRAAGVQHDAARALAVSLEATKAVSGVLAVLGGGVAIASFSGQVVEALSGFGIPVAAAQTVVTIAGGLLAAWAALAEYAVENGWPAQLRRWADEEEARERGEQTPSSPSPRLPDFTFKPGRIPRLPAPTTSGGLDLPELFALAGLGVGVLSLVRGR